MIGIISIRRLDLVTSALCLILSGSSAVRAADHFLTIGGGNSVSNNQVSLEKNVIYLQRFLSSAGLDSAPHEILFSDGNGTERDIEFDDPRLPAPRINQLLARVFNRESGLNTQYRVHEIPHVWGAATRGTISRWFDTVGTKIPDGDRLIIYFTGHGGHGSPPRNTNFVLWHEPAMSVSEFTGLLDRLPPHIAVVLVMVQCFSGGFADVIYGAADPAKGLSAQNRCGFFATTFDRTAAGCTSDIEEEDYHDYSTSFWAALYGRTRTGQTVAFSDYDGDGRVSLAEAHAFTLISSDTVDLSLKTSDEFLRHFSSIRANDPNGLVTPDIGFEPLLKLASPVDRAVLIALASQLQLEAPGSVQSARNMVGGLEMRRKSIEERKRRLEKDHNVVRLALQTMLRQRWPELDNLLNPQATRAIQSDGDQMIRAVESAPSFAQFQKQEGELDQMETESFDLERKWVKCQRFIRVAETVALAANLPLLATPQIRQRYQELLAAENASIGVRPN